ncbi:hypothetical protein Tamer19_72610 [Cupriavidus sp. TA19]|uniref:DUF7940 domain-containing protein n=1 Tax=Cupriavidus sp. TA19 TaxID=701108 RepID=UPI0027294CE5|nr:hypothetical protein [Cupriavidus sp. TA19]GLC97852.1 hypothetical protein Tamer19_72610 [Cupriavidus sp. TA19]
MKVVENWNKLWKSTTVLLSLLLAALSAAQVVLPSLQTVLEPKQFAMITLGVAVLIGALRYVAQPSLKTDDKPTDQP